METHVMYSTRPHVVVLVEKTRKRRMTFISMRHKLTLKRNICVCYSVIEIQQKISKIFFYFNKFIVNLKIV